jgi:ParB family chromosome partitioning protein
MEKRLKIADIKIGERHRKDFGDLRGLAHSIKTFGLLQAIGVTKDGYRLLFGERRLRATKMNGDTEIDCRILDIKDIWEAERVENEFRKDLTFTEKHALAKALNAEAAQTEHRGGDRRSEKAKNQSGQPDHFDSGRRERTRERIAAKAGFVDTNEMRRVNKVMEKGAPEIIEAMDAEEITVGFAARLAEGKSKEEQVVVLNAIRSENGNTRAMLPPESKAVWFTKKMDDILATVRGVNLQFGGASEMFASPLWATATAAEKRRCIQVTIMASEELASLASEMKQLSKKG